MVIEFIWLKYKATNVAINYKNILVIQALKANAFSADYLNDDYISKEIKYIENYHHLFLD